MMGIKQAFIVGQLSLAVKRLLALKLLPFVQDNRIRHTHKSCRQRNVNNVEKRMRGKHTTRRKRAWHRAKSGREREEGERSVVLFL